MQPEEQKPEEQQPEEREARPVSWRKAHPRLSRAILYSCLVLIGGTGLLLLQARRRQDRADRHQYIETRLGMLDLLFGTEFGRQSILETIQEDGMLDADVPASLRQQVLRVQAQVMIADNRLDEAREVLETAEGLDVGPAEAMALRIERAEFEVMEERGEKALALLRDEAPWGDPLLELARAGEEAYVLELLDRADEARELLEKALEEAPTPLPSKEGPRVGLAPLTAGHLVASLTARLAGPDGPGVGYRAWLRVARLAPDDATALRVAADALDKAGRGEEAARLRGRAAALAPPKETADKPPVRDETFLEYPLKRGAEDGR